MYLPDRGIGKGNGLVEELCHSLCIAIEDNGTLKEIVRVGEKNLGILDKKLVAVELVEGGLEKIIMRRQRVENDRTTQNICLAAKGFRKRRGKHR